MLFVTVAESVSIHYRLVGDGPKKIVLIMGLGGTFSAFLPLATELSKSGEYQCLIFDNRGVGSSSIPSGRYTTSQMAEDTLALVNHLGPEWNKVHVVGISMGGMIAQEFAYRLIEGNRLLSLTLMVTHAGGFSAYFTPFSGIYGLLKTIMARTREEKAARVINNVFSQEYLNKLHESGVTNREFVQQQYLQRLSEEPLQPFHGFLGHVTAVWTHNFHEERLHKLRDSGAKILILTGTNDNLVDHRNSLYLEKILKPSEFLVFEGSGHGVHVEQFTEIANAIRRVCALAQP